jgi:hypothetical protein
MRTSSDIKLAAGFIHRNPLYQALCAQMIGEIHCPNRPLYLQAEMVEFPPNNQRQAPVSLPAVFVIKNLLKDGYRGV